jgi:hypothetical protein
MKKFFFIVTLALVSVSAFAQSSPKTATKGKSTASSATLSDLSAQEKTLWEGFKNKDTKPFEKTLAPDAIEVNARGIDDRAAIIHNIGTANCSVKSVGLDGFKLMKVDADAVLLTYKGSANGTCDGKPFAPVYASTLWVKRGEKWMPLFHQETEIPKSK